jgi:hypothetical protein
MKTFSVYLLVIAISVISVANAQVPAPQPPPINQIMKDLDNGVPITMKVTDTAIAAQLSALAKPETAQKMARYVKNFQNALIKEGFTREEALKIVTSMPLPATSTFTK